VSCIVRPQHYSPTIVLIAADEQIERVPAPLDFSTQTARREHLLAPPPLHTAQSEPALYQHTPEESWHAVPPRREYVWRTVAGGQQSLGTIASRSALDLETKLSSIRRLNWSDQQTAHRCAGYLREEITLAATTSNSAVVSHDAPSPLEMCSVCHEIVGSNEKFQCICGEPCEYHSKKWDLSSHGRRSWLATYDQMPGVQ
jgi:hypothetical protein